MNENTTYIFASKQADDNFAPEEIITSLEEFYANLEYGDVKKGEYQLWEYPSGKISLIKPDREVSEKDHYSTPYTAKGTVWLPKLEEVGVDQQKVNTALNSLGRTE